MERKDVTFKSEFCIHSASWVQKAESSWVQKAIGVRIKLGAKSNRCKNQAGCKKCEYKEGKHWSRNSYATPTDYIECPAGQQWMLLLKLKTTTKVFKASALKEKVIAVGRGGRGGGGGEEHMVFEGK